MCVLVTACGREETLLCAATGPVGNLAERDGRYGGRGEKIHCLKMRRAERSGTLARW